MNSCLVREWHERVATDASAQMPNTTNFNSDFVSPVKLLTGSADDFFSDEILCEAEDDTPMKKKTVCI